MPESRGRRPRRPPSGRPAPRAPRARTAPEAEAPAASAEPRRRTVLLVGATGALGGHIARELASRGYRIRALVRDPLRLKLDVDEVFSGDLVLPNTLKNACSGVDAVISCAGAKVGFAGLRGGRYSYAHIDDRGNRNLLVEAQAAAVKKFVYVSVFGGRILGAVEYIRAHESFATALKLSGLDYAVIRPSGFFSAYRRVFDMARKGRVTIIGNGSARTNPIADEDLAAVCVDSLDGHRQETEVGGPDVISRREIAELAFQALGKEPRFRRIPSPFAAYGVRLSRLTGRHNYDIAQFFALASITDLVAPQVGTRRLEDYFSHLAEATAPARDT